MSAPGLNGRQVLLVGLEGRICAVPLRHVIETMRPLPIEYVANIPAFISGIAVIRGIPTPVIDLGALLGTPIIQAGRFVTIRAADRQVALSVNAVFGVRDLGAINRIGKLPPLLESASVDALEMIGTLDDKVLMVLRDGWQLPEEVWEAILAEEAIS